MIPFSLAQQTQLRAVALDAARRPSMAAVSPAEMSLLALAARLAPTEILFFETDLALWDGQSDYPTAQGQIQFRCPGIVIALGFCETTTGAIWDQRFQITSNYGSAEPFVFNNLNNALPIPAAAYFSNQARPREVCYQIRSKDETWTVRLDNMRTSAVHPVLSVEFVPAVVEP